MFITLSAFVCLSAAHANEIKIAAIVNDGVITVTDVEDRMRLYLLGSKGQPPAEFIKKLTKQTLEELIDESLQNQEAAKYGIQIPEEQINAGIEEIAKRNNATADIMIKQFKTMGVNIQSLRDKIKAEFTWPLLVRRKWQSQISISEQDIDFAIEKMNDIDEPQYLLAEILLIVPERGKEEETRTKAFKLLTRIKEGTPFSTIALQNSQAPGAAAGGDIGWMKESQLDEKIVQALSKMKAGDLSEPVRSAKGWTIVLLRDVKKSDAVKENVKKDDEKSRDAIASQLGTKRLTQMAQHYMNDLRSSAFIDKRM